MPRAPAPCNNLIAHAEPAGPPPMMTTVEPSCKRQSLIKLSGNLIFSSLRLCRQSEARSHKSEAVEFRERKFSFAASERSILLLNDRRAKSERQLDGAAGRD